MPPRSRLAALAAALALALAAGATPTAAAPADAAPPAPALHAQLDRAVTLAWAGDLPAALAAYRAARAIDPSSHAARAGEARILGWQGDTDAARAGFRAILAESPDDVEALLGLAAVHRMLDEPAAARALYRHALAIAPDHVEARDGLGALAREQRVHLAAGLEARRAGATDTRSSHVDARLDLPRHRWLGATFSTNAPDGLPGARLSGWRAGASAGLRTRHLAGALGYELSRDRGVATHGVAGEVSTPALGGALGLAARVRRTDGGDLAALASIGGERPISGTLVVGARLFGATGSHAADDAVAAGAMLLWHPGRLDLRLDLSEARRHDGRTTTAAARTAVALTRTFGLAVLARVERGATSATSAGAEVLVDF